MVTIMHPLCRALAVAAGIIVVSLTSATPARASRESETLRTRGKSEIFSLDRDRALVTFRQAIAADPQDPGAYRGLATVFWLNITFKRGNMTVDDYLGQVNRQSIPYPPPPADAVAAFQDAVGKSIALSRERVAAHPRDADAHFQLGAALGLRASYVATVDASALAAFRAAREAYQEHEVVIEVDPARKDAGLIVGTYRYIIAALSLPLRWVAYVAGFGGDKDRGIRMIEDAAAFNGDNQDDARFALLLLYNRERRYDDALKTLQVLRDRYPRNRLVWLESGSTNLRAGRPAEAERFLSDGIARFATDERPRMFGEDALWYYKRGAARRALGRTADATADLKRALATEGRKWVYGRSHLELGRLALAAGNKAAAREEFQTAVTLCSSDNDQVSADEARQLLK